MKLLASTFDGGTAIDGSAMGPGDGDGEDAERLVGRYANYLEIGRNAFEFVFDFGQLHREGREPQFHTRIITSPVYAKAFMETFRDAIESYEREYGAIPADEERSQNGG
jgi:hypothetical protein